VFFSKKSTAQINSFSVAEYRNLDNMPGVEIFPPEVLQDIIFQLSSPADLLNCSIANRALSEAAFPELYRHIDLTKAEDIDDEGRVQLAMRQVRLLRSVAEYKIRFHDRIFTANDVFQ